MLRAEGLAKLCYKGPEGTSSGMTEMVDQPPKVLINITSFHDSVLSESQALILHFNGSDPRHVNILIDCCHVLHYKGLLLAAWGTCGSKSSDRLFEEFVYLAWLYPPLVPTNHYLSRIQGMTIDLRAWQIWRGQ